MTPDRLRQIEELYHSVREAAAGDRSELLERADPELRREVESLLERLDDPLTLDGFAPLGADATVAIAQPGEFLGPYQVESKLGEGGMGEVFRAIDTRLGRPVAIKFAHERFTARFEREARAISALNHPHICTLYDIGPNYLVMELIEGETISARLKRGPLPADQAVQYARQIVDALVDAHGRGIVHRDLKPGNIMLAKSGVKVLDFGLATWDGDDSQTGSQMVIGTPAYMAPEQREGKLSDSRADLFSFGCLFYEMLTGERATAVHRKAVTPKALEKIIRRCMQTDPAKRWQSATELKNALGALETKRGIGMFAGVAVLATLLILGYFMFLRPAPKLTDQDMIVLGDFANSTGEPIFDGTLRQGLAFQLEQSPFLKIMDDEQVRRVVRLMSLPPGGQVTAAIAHEICVREAAAATIDGTIARLGRDYVITLEAITCRDGATLAREQVQAEDREHVLAGVGTAATAMRAKLGESRNSIRNLNRPLEQATTSSLAALQSYSAGFSLMGEGNFLAAVPLLERAIAIDPNFAMAYYFLGVGYEQAGDMTRCRDYAKQAFRFVDRVSEYERDQIGPYYYYWVTGEVDKAIDSYQLGERNYPRTWSFHNLSSMVFIDLGRFEEALKEGLESARVQPHVEHSYRRQLDAYICLDRLAEAKELAQRLRAQGLGETRIHQRYLEMAYVEDDQAAIDREIQWFAGKPGEYISLGLQAANRNVHGQRRESRQLYLRAAETARRKGLDDVAADLEGSDARADALSENCQTAHALGGPGLALALCGDAAQAEKLAAETSKLFPNGTIWNAVQLPAIRAALALSRDQPATSVELLASASPYERAFLEVSYLRGLAYLRLHKGAEAVAEFRKIVDHKGANWATDWRHPFWGQFYSPAVLGLARGFAAAGDTAEAKKAYRDLFELWKAADADSPVLRQARAEYSKLP